MLKFVFWVLVALNAALFAYAQGYLGKPAGGEREPQRLKSQLATERMVMLSPSEARAAAEAIPAPAEAPVTEPAPAPVAPPVETIACTQAGAFAAGDARRFETRIARLDLGARALRTSVPFQEVTSHLVYLPPNGGKEGADRRVAELKEKGVQNFFVMQGESPLKWAVSLGVFKTETAAQTLAAALGKQGIRGVRVLPRGPQGTRAAWQFRDLTTGERAQVAGIADDFAGVQLRPCG
ncbi:SPOR domain-containing protein [Massilia sp. IC2-476]|uniref:SPOR domain-containing protein n=1 Tax=Massilia sp. IC2-476 TaxID=2887199 RepID=UPI001D0F4FB4|nr:SPOR domain-containing protein [Massilia sp. IC2-476]MCC2971299.1 SPOR domain-containing protein [Massilia sp. IC2-476]